MFDIARNLASGFAAQSTEEVSTLWVYLEIFVGNEDFLDACTVIDMKSTIGHFRDCGMIMTGGVGRGGFAAWLTNCKHWKLMR